MRAALAAHDEVLRGAIEAHGGWLFKHTGDGVCAAFASPRSAVDAAMAAQRALELPVRMGMATGEAELRDGDYFGPEALDVEADSFDDSYRRALRPDRVHRRRRRVADLRSARRHRGRWGPLPVWTVRS